MPGVTAAVDATVKGDAMGKHFGSGLALVLSLSMAGPSVAQDGSATDGTTSDFEVATVVDIVDGDTIKVETGNGPESLRYIGIDTPETVDPSESVELLGPAAAAANAELVAGKMVVLEKDVSETDRFGRSRRAGTSASLPAFRLRGRPGSTTKDYVHAEAKTEAGARPAVRANCDSSYPGVCIRPYPPDLDCGQIGFRRFAVRGPDRHGFDGDDDGIGCES